MTGCEITVSVVVAMIATSLCSGIWARYHHIG
eukprot:COSAG02_NODE_64375_length_260_cov_1.583851_2_plen_31_part_01